MPIFCIFY
ncbi:unnamed protein product [Larinioides sclopetarius]|uniref:Uncharacterized protein n=1 Tax=Larinioides sclopetarius TaxID=280406 RepID=A0AAV2A5V0_9ARAC